MPPDNSADHPNQSFSFGYQLITWDFGPLSRLEHGLAKVAEEGFTTFELLLGDTLGSDFARRSLTLGPLAEPTVVPDSEIFRRLGLVAGAEAAHGIAPASVYADGEWTNPLLWPTEFAKIQVLTRFLQGCGASVLACGGGPPQLGRPRAQEAYTEFAERLKAIGAYTSTCGIRTVYHPHLDTFVETREQLDRLMDVLDTDVVGLCIDPAHFQVKRDDPVDIFKTYSSVIDYVHFKDCNGDESTLTGYDRYLGFCELGAGIIDLAGIVEALLAAQYSGVVTVELDYSDTPDESCRRNATFIRDSLGLTMAGGK
jgi:inosose dehydratase